MLFGFFKQEIRVEKCGFTSARIHLSFVAFIKLINAGVEGFPSAAKVKGGAG